MVKNRQKLGRGISKLMEAYDIKAETKTFDTDSDYIPSCPLEDIIPNKNQPRKQFLETEISDLSDSIKQNGLLQPILTRKLENGKFEIVAGERRYRASKKAGLETIPIFVKTLSDKDVLILSIIENVQREDLTPIEEAKAYQLMIADYKVTQQEVSEAVSKSRATVTNMIRLLKLPKKVQDYISDFRITAGHGKILLSLEKEEDILKFAEMIIVEHLSVRKLEELIKENKDEKPKKVKKIIKETTSPQIKEITEKLSTRFNTKIKVNDKNNKGKILIEYGSKEEFDELISILLNKGE
jgi:ParB family chromosome partitioning protein